MYSRCGINRKNKPKPHQSRLAVYKIPKSANLTVNPAASSPQRHETTWKPPFRCAQNVNRPAFGQRKLGRHYVENASWRCKIWKFSNKYRINNCILPVQPSNHALNMFDNLWTYIGYFSLHFPNDWSTNCRPMVATHYTRFVGTWLCIGGDGPLPCELTAVDAPLAYRRAQTTLGGKPVANYKSRKGKVQQYAQDGITIGDEVFSPAVIKRTRPGTD